MSSIDDNVSDRVQDNVRAIIYVPFDKASYDNAVVFLGYPNESDFMDEESKSEFKAIDLYIEMKAWRQSWQCGDGCCSESWMNAHVVVKHGESQIFINDYEEIRQCDTSDIFNFVLDRLKDHIDNFVAIIEKS